MSDFVSQGTLSEKSLDTDGPGGGGRVVGAKGDRSRRSWSPREEEVLLLALKDLVSNRWKSDNGFRAGYLTRVEEILKRELPTTDMKVHPHIHSKINTWKRCYHSLSLILDRSGVGFNSDGDWKIECNDEQWAQIVKADSNARYMRYKAWPYYEDWKHIYGKDRAAGMRVEGMTQAYSKMGAVPSPNSETFVDAVNMILDDLLNPGGDPRKPSN
ncbi:hypothetical protein AAHA92_28414 [Salvia divinorum]|uniref:Myb/SANT-like domain-containing protein n=1 Tax=Salvia divinorum TaxID=28513 RepID=A0ABD1FXF1_SALDI